MRSAAELLRHEPGARIFFLAHAQSSLGTGAAYVGLVLIAYDRLRSPWAISIVLLAEFLPAIVLGPVFGAAADRWSRRTCAVVADAARAVAFVGIGLVGGIELTVALALVAGTGTGLFTPAVLAGLPSLVRSERLPAATALYGAISDFGHTIGPALAALALLALSPEALMIANGVTFAASAILLARLPFGERPAQARGDGGGTLLRQAAAGLRATAGMPGVRVIVAASAAVVLFAGMLNVGELLLVTEELDGGESEFSLLVAVFGLGVVAGSFAASRGGSLLELKRRYLAGLLLTALGLLGAGAAPVLALAFAAFALGGVGNGLVLAHERLIFQRSVPDALLGRVFGVKDAAASAAFAVAFLSAGAIVSVLDSRTLFLIAGAGGLVVWMVSLVALRRSFDDGSRPSATEPDIHGITGEVLAVPGGNPVAGE